VIINKNILFIALQFLAFESQSQEIEILNKKEFLKEINVDDGLRIYNFWATWCKPCVEELPYFVSLSKAHPDVQITLVSLDFVDRIESGVKPLLEKMKIDLEVVVLDGGNPNEWIEKVSANWSGAIPATLIRNEKENYFYEKQFEEGELEQIIKNIKE
jgi:thiol-disulfide isomerase/thioredoxin